MSELVTGVVSKHDGFVWQNKTLRSINLEGHIDGKYPKKYSVGEVDLEAQYPVGTTISFARKAGGNPKYWNVDMTTIKVATSAPTPAPQAPAAAPRAQAPAASAGSKDSYWADKEAYQKEVVEPRISYTASRGQAITLVCAALAHDALALGAAKGKRLDLLLGMVDQVTDRFLLQSVHAPEHLKQVEKDRLAVTNVIPTEAEFNDDIPF